MKILIVLSSDEYVRNYGQTDAFALLRGEHDCYLVLSDRCKQVAQMRDFPGFLGTFKTKRSVDRAHYDLFNVLTWRHRARSRTFRYRFSRLYRERAGIKPLHLLENLIGLRKAAIYVLLGNRWAAKLSIPWLISRLAVNPDLERIAREVAPDLVIFPCSANDPIGNDLARLGPALGCRTLFLVDNWDNLSSKTIFWAAPDFLGVWGEQSREHAARIHGIGPERVFTIGTPRFERYYSIRKQDTKGPYPFPYILFCGASLAFNELEALQLLDQELTQHPDIYGESRIVYRPHPERQPRSCPDLFREQDFARVVLDEQIKERYYKRGYVFPSLDYYPGLLAGAQLVVCPLTTMLVESVICGTPVLAICYDDGIHYTSPHNALKYYLHFEGIEQIVGLTLNRERTRLALDMRALFQQKLVLQPDQVNASLEYFLHHDEHPYAERLATVVRAIASVTRPSKR